MTETEYINATNLAKLRIADAAVRDTVFLDSKGAARRNSVANGLYDLIHELEEVVVVEEGRAMPAAPVEEEKP